MADRPILFSGPMVRALLDGRKTQTRRVLSLKGHRTFSEFGPSDTPGYDWHFRDAEKRWHDLTDSQVRARLAYALGERLWVKEDHWRYGFYAPVADRKTKGGGQKWAFGALKDDVLFEPPPGARNGFSKLGERSPVGWYKRLARFMPRACSRQTLIVEAVKVERLTDISEADAMAEGVDHNGPCDHARQSCASIGCLGPNSYRGSFYDLWESINSARSWNANPWVVAVTFRVVRANIDAVAETA